MEAKAALLGLVALIESRRHDPLPVRVPLVLIEIIARADVYHVISSRYFEELLIKAEHI